MLDQGKESGVYGDGPLELSFGSAEVRASGACNTMKARYRVERGRLVVMRLGLFPIGCDDLVTRQDERFFAFLTAGPVLRLSSTSLVLTTASVEVGFEETR